MAEARIDNGRQQDRSPNNPWPDEIKLRALHQLKLATKDIDNRQYLRYPVGMSTRIRPPACCEQPTQPPDLAAPVRDQLVAIFKAFADPTRLDIFRLIAAQEAPLCVCDVVDRFQVSQPTISHHLKVLRDAGLITVSRRGVWAFYAVDPHGLALVRDSLAALAPAAVALAR